MPALGRDAPRPDPPQPDLPRPAAGRWAAGLVAGRRPSPVDVACLGPVLVGPFFSLAMLPVVPALVGTHPVLLETLTGSTASMVAAGAFARVGRAPVLLAFAAPIVGLMAFDPFTWWAGRRYGPRILAFYARQGARQRRHVERAERLARRWGAWTVIFAYYIQPIPNAVIYFAAGADGMSLWRFLLLDLTGTLLWSTVVVGLGFALGRPAIDLATTISHYALGISVALVVGLVALSLVRGRQR